MPALEDLGLVCHPRSSLLKHSGGLMVLRAGLQPAPMVVLLDSFANPLPRETLTSRPG